MNLPPAVSDASPLIVFHQVGRRDLIRAALGQVLIPSAVASEIAPSLGDPLPWMRVMQPSSVRGTFPWESPLAPGEAEAIALALELFAGQILRDDRPARRTAEQLGLRVVGSLGLLLEAHRQGRVSDVRAK